MQNVIALLSDYHKSRAIKAVAVLDEAIRTGSVYNVELVDAKEYLGSALRAVVNLWQEEYLTAHRAGQTSDVEQDIYYWYAVLTNLPGLHKKLAKHANLPLVAKFIALTAEFVPYAEAVKGKSFEVIKGRKPSTEPVKPVDLSNTGTCAICGKRHKLRGGKLVDHGYQISDGHGHYFGFRNGKCFGVGFRPYEVSNEANIAFDKAADDAIKAENTYMAKLVNEEVALFTYAENERVNGRWSKVTKTVTKAQDATVYERERLKAIGKTGARITGWTAAKKENAVKIETWVARPLEA